MADLSKRRTPSQWRNLLEVRVRRLSSRKSPDERREAFASIAAVALAALAQHEADHGPPS